MHPRKRPTVYALGVNRPTRDSPTDVFRLTLAGPARAILSVDGGVYGAGGGVPEKGTASRGDLSSRLRGKSSSGRGGGNRNGGGNGNGNGNGNGHGNGKSGDKSPAAVSVFGKDSSEIVGRFTWRVDNFTKLKDVLKKRKMSGLSVKSR